MNPIPTTNAMKPAPGKGVSSFPTPVIKDTVIVEVVNAWKGDYQPLEYGTKWDDTQHASIQGSYPDHKLISQSPNSEDGQWVKRIWANDRVDQDLYNYAIKYSGGSQEHPIYIRTYVEPRETYAPLPDLTPDPTYPNALLVEEEVQRQDGELDSRYVKVIRTYETLQGPIISSQRVNDRGDLETVLVQQVTPNTPPDQDGLLVTQTQVLKEDVSKGTKTTATVQSHSQLLIKEKKEGLLGETTTTDDIVDPSTQPDALSQSVVASVVQQTSATKAVKRTTTASGPTSLTKNSKDGKLLGDVTSIQSVVSPNAQPDSLSPNLLSSEVNQVDSGKAIKTNIILNSTPILIGSQTGEGLLGTRTTTERIVQGGAQADSVSETVISSQVEPIDSVRSRKITVQSFGPTSLNGSKINERGDTETVTESIVPAGTNPDPDGLYQISSQVDSIDSAKSKKTTTTVAAYETLSVDEKKEGLLGETITTDSVVAVGTLPDKLSQSIVASSVQKISKTKAIKKTTTSTGPASLSRKSNDGKLLGNIVETQTVVAPNSSPDPVSYNILSSEIRQVDSGKAIKTNVTLIPPANLSGRDKKAGLLGETKTTESIVPAGAAPDSLSETIISSTVEPIDSVRSRKTTVEIDGGNILVGQRSNERGDVETITESIVPAGTNATPGSLSNVSSEVEPIDSKKSKLRNVTIASYEPLPGAINRPGLLGNTTTIETISGNSSADQLSFTGAGGVVESTVTPISKGKFKKVTVTSSGPTSLESDSLVDSPLGLVAATVTKKIVDKLALPTNSLTKIKDIIDPIDSQKSQQETIDVQSWPTNVGVNYDEQLGIGIYYEETIVSPSDYKNNSNPKDLAFKDYKPIDLEKSFKREYDKGRISQVLSSQWYKIGIDVNVSLPDVLEGVTVYWGKSGGVGQQWDGGQSAGTGSYSYSASGSSSNSAAINGDVYFNLRQGYNGVVQGYQHIFFVEIGDDGKVSSGDILKILNNLEDTGMQNPPKPTPPQPGQPIPPPSSIKVPDKYKPWPYLRLKTENFVLVSGSTKETISKSISKSSNINGNSSGSGSGSSIDVDVNVKSVTIPPSIHGLINITEEFEGSFVSDLSPTYFVKPKKLDYTQYIDNTGKKVNTDKFPVGEYLYSSNVELYKYGFVKVTAVTVDITTAYV